MNPESQYPALKLLKENEIFIEWAIIVISSEILKLPIRAVFNEESKKTIRCELKEKFKADDVYMSYITKV